MRRALALALALAASACSTLTHPAAPSVGHATATPPSDALCESLTSQHRTAGGIAAGGAVMGGVGGLAAGLDSGNAGGRLAIGISALVVGGIAAAAQFISMDAASEYTLRGCDATR